MKLLVMYNSKSSLDRIQSIKKILSKKVNFSYFDIKHFYKKNNFQENKFIKFLEKKKPNLILDLLPIPNNALNSEKYLELINKLYKLRKIIKKSNIKTLKISYSWINRFDISPFKFFLLFRNLFFYFKNFYLKNIYRFNITDYTILTGNKCENNEKYFNSKKIYFKHYDYLAKPNAKYVKNRIIYIDQYLEAHPDFVRYGLKFITKKKFSSEIKSFFDKLEAKGYKVVVALHPKNTSKDLKNIYGNRIFIKNKTFELINNSYAVITHCSTAIHFAVQSNKPILFILTDELEKTFLGDRIFSQAKFFKHLPINISNRQLKSSDIIIPKIKKKIYENYTRRFLRHDLYVNDTKFKQEFLKLIL